MKQLIDKAVEQYRELILQAERQIWSTPETGYKEYKTSAYLAGEFEKLGYELTYADGITGFGTGSTDMGDITCIMPAIHPYACGAAGKSHGNDYEIVNPVEACVNSAKFQVGMLYVLLSDGAERAKKIVDGFTPLFASKEAYLAYVDSLACAGDRIIYKEDGDAEVILGCVPGDDDTGENI